MPSRIRRSMADKDQGFTLIELLVVIIIIGILAAIAIPVFLNQRKKAVDASMKSDLKNAATLVETWTIDNPGIPIPNSADNGGWMDNASPGFGALTGAKLSPGTLIWTRRANRPGGYCLYLRNRSSSIAPVDTGPYMTYSSMEGGLQSETYDGNWCP